MGDIEALEATDDQVLLLRSFDDVCIGFEVTTIGYYLHRPPVPTSEYPILSESLALIN